jgi:hypothetical protein
MTSGNWAAFDHDGDRAGAGQVGRFVGGEQKGQRRGSHVDRDGASYHSAPTARDRDRLRQQQLEALGWRFHRIWSTDWFLRRDEEIKRTLAAYQSAIAYADDLDSHHSQVGVTSLLQVAPPLEHDRPRERDPRPNVSPGRDIDEYSPRELQSLVRWVLSDGCLPTDDEIVTELTRDLGFIAAARGSSPL